MTRTKRTVILVAALAVVVTSGIVLWNKLYRREPYVQPDGLEARFKYGLPERQIGPEVPYWVWLALPRIFPDMLPTPGGYKSLDMPWEPGEALPVGFSLQTIGYPRVKTTCAVCHSTTYRLRESDTPALVVLASGRSWVQEGYEKFLRDAANDDRFSTKEVLYQIGYLYPLSTLDKLLYRIWIIPATRRALRAETVRSPHAFTEYDKRERAGWLLQVSAAKYPFPIDTEKAQRGNQVYAQHCASCHEPGMPKFGTKIDIAEIKTDPVRLESWTTDDDRAARMAIEARGGKLASDPVKGYIAGPIEGLWLRAPYLHNGSVPTMRDLLRPEKERPSLFYRGYDVYDASAVGFISSGPAAVLHGIRFEASTRGGSNRGHLYGTDLADADKDRLIEFLKTF